jgi:hypothetical protein
MVRTPREDDKKNVGERSRLLLIRRILMRLIANWFFRIVSSVCKRLYLKPRVGIEFGA